MSSSRMNNAASNIYGSMSIGERQGSNQLESDDENNAEEEMDNFGENETEEEEEDVVEEATSAGRRRLKRKRQPLCAPLVKRLKQAYIFLFKVDEDVWGSPNVNHKHKIAVNFWLVAFSLGYATERSTFKVLIDHAGPFRMFAAEAITGLYAICVGFVLFTQALIDKSCFTCYGIDFPLVDIGVMAILDTIQLLLCVISGSKIPPIFVVLLAQMVTPLTMILTKYFKRQSPVVLNASSQEGYDHIAESSQIHFQDLPYTGRQILGAAMITLAVIVGLYPALFEVFDPFSSLTAYNSGCNIFLFLLSCVPAALSTLYKEYSIAEYKLPVSVTYLNFVLAICQVIFTGILAPLVYPLQGFAQQDDWEDLYESPDIKTNFMDGIKCFAGNEEISDYEYPEPAECRYLWLLLLTYVLSVIISGVAVDKVIKGGAYKVLYRGLSVGVILAMIVMWWYDENYYDKSTEGYDSYMYSVNLLSAIIVVFGLDLYYRDPLSETTFETTYQAVLDYDDYD